MTESDATAARLAEIRQQAEQDPTEWFTPRIVLELLDRIDASERALQVANKDRLALNRLLAETAAHRTCYARVGILETWTPTAAAINALPQPLYRYIESLEARDPAHEVRQRIVAEDQVWQLEAKLAEVIAERDSLERRYVDECADKSYGLRLLRTADREASALKAERAEIVAVLDDLGYVDPAEKTLVQRLSDEIADFKMVMDHCSKVYDHFSGGQISKPNTLPREVIAIAEQRENDHIEEAIERLCALIQQAEGQSV